MYETLVDAHVHVRPCFDVSQFMEGAFDNFEEVACQSCRDGTFCGVLCLVSTSQGHEFRYLLNSLPLRRPQSCHSLPAMSLVETQECVSFGLSFRNGSNLVFIAGQQLVSLEGLEVLAIGTCEQFEAGKPTDRLIQEIAQVGAIPVIPWGAGKWFGRRGRLVDELIRSPDLPPFFLGDSGNRPAVWPKPSLFREAEKRGIVNLPGSDPLPFSSEVQRVGSFGVALNSSLDLGKPALDLKRTLLDPSTTLHQFGEGETTLRFMRNQFKMQLRKLTQ